MTQTPSDSTTTGNGEPQTTDALFGAVYDRLKAMAGTHLARDRGGGSTLDTTALVHELYLRVSTNRELLFGKPVQLIDGDLHIYRSDNPLAQGASCATEYAPASDTAFGPFSWQRMIQP